MHLGDALIRHRRQFDDERRWSFHAVTSLRHDAAAWYTVERTRPGTAFYRAHLTRIIEVDLKSELFTYTINERALTHARMMDGKLLLVTNTKDLAPDEVVRRYKSLADIERGFRILKSEIEIGPIYHRLLDRIPTARTRS